jgi:hypothetical protein
MSGGKKRRRELHKWWKITRWGSVRIHALTAGVSPDMKAASNGAVGGNTEGRGRRKEIPGPRYLAR